MSQQHLDRLDQLAPLLRMPAAELVTRAHAQLGLTLLVVHTWRDLRQQAAIYQVGRTYNRATGDWDVTDKGAVRTYAKPGTSAHNIVTHDGAPASLALDVVPLTPEGLPDWEALEATWQRLYALAADCGLDPYGDRWGAYLPGDKGHLEEPGWKLKLDALGLILPAATVEAVT